MSEPKIITYTNLLHKYRDPKAPEVQKFLKENKDDDVFVKRAKTLNRLFELKAKLVEI